MARLNACLMQETPQDFVAAWSFFRSYYLFPPATPIGQFYKHGIKPSPPSHYQIIHDVAAYRLAAFAAPRSFAKSTLVREIVLLETLTRPFWETVIFLAKEQFVTTQLDLYKSMLTGNQRITDDFGWYWRRQLGVDGFKPKRGEGLWSNHIVKTTTGSIIHGMPVRGASLGKRPHRILFDDVEKDDALVKCPTELIDAFRDLLLNTVYPMAEEGCCIDIFGTLLSRRSFLYWLMETKDSRFEENWHRTRLAVRMHGHDIWPEKMGTEWQANQKATMGVAAFNTQYMNEPSTEENRVLRIHDDLCTYRIENKDQDTYSNPLVSKATLVTHQLTGYENGDRDGRPITRAIARPWGETVSRMYRFMTVDWAPSTSETSDYSAIHCMGLESSKDFRDTLWSLDLWLDKKRQHEVVKEVYRMAVRWQPRIVGVEAFGPYMELYERLKEDLPGMFGKFGGVAPAVIPIKFPPHLEKADKIKGLEWRFDQFRIKLPEDQKLKWPYSRLWKEIEDFTDDMALLDHDDAIDTLAMHQAIGKPARHGAADVLANADDPIELLKAGKRFTSFGLGALSGIDITSIPAEVLEQALEQRRLQLENNSDNFRRWVTR